METIVLMLGFIGMAVMFLINDTHHKRKYKRLKDDIFNGVENKNKRICAGCGQLKYTTPYYSYHVCSKDCRDIVDDEINAN
jgi:hypothetical protein